MEKYAAELGFWRDLIGEKGKVPEPHDDRMLKHLCVKADHFDGMKVLEIGSGPLGWSLALTGCELWAIDPLIDEYRAMGYPLADGVHYVTGFAEDMPFADDEFDAVIAFNAIDHVDDFDKACKEIERVCKPDGIIRIEVHYHPWMVCEPMELDDKIVRAAFSPKVKKLIERPYGATFHPGHPDSPSYEGTVALWSNDPTLVE